MLCSSLLPVLIMILSTCNLRGLPTTVPINPMPVADFSHFFPRSSSHQSIIVYPYCRSSFSSYTGGHGEWYGIQTRFLGVVYQIQVMLEEDAKLVSLPCFEIKLASILILSHYQDLDIV
jgi:hypothetical protein